MAKIIKAAVIALVIGPAAAGVASGHGLGQSFEEVIDNYFVDVGVDALELVAGEPARFDFSLWDKDRLATIEFTDAWVRIAPQGQGAVFAGDLHQPEFGALGMTYEFPKAGKYELTVRFQNEGESVVEASFPLEVGAGTSDSPAPWQNWAVGGVAGLALGFAAARFLKKT